ncbi:MAG TPA: 2-phosphosulfolactate phosphatase [Dysgonamonadaceae bacterium]|nr:2-phosphosulfolactate phosphatase [Dysgonamonadaceae bacterium]
MTIDICFSPALLSYYAQPNDVVVVTDIFRATTTMCMAFSNGAKSIIPVASIEEAEEYKQNGYLVGAERNTKRCTFADFGNSPFEYTENRVKNKEIVFTTTNGTLALHAAKESGKVLIGAFSNIEAVVEKSIELGERIVVLCAGWNNKVNMEDLLFAGVFAEKLSAHTSLNLDSDAAKIALDLWNIAKENVADYLKGTDHYHRLVANGLEKDIQFCLQQNTLPLVPFYDKREAKIRVR